MENYPIEAILPIPFYRVIPYGNLYLSTQFDNKYPRRTARMKKILMGFVTFVTYSKITNLKQEALLGRAQRLRLMHLTNGQTDYC